MAEGVDLKRTRAAVGGGLLAALLALGVVPGAAVAQTKIERRAGQPKDDSRLEFLRKALKRLSHNSAELAFEVEGETRTVEIDCGKLKTQSSDYARIETLANGQVLALEGASAIKLRTELPLEFAETRVEPGNLSPGYAGLYSLWLARDEAGRWQLRLNSEPDVWGSMHDPAADVGEIELTHSLDESAVAEELSAVLTESPDAAGGTLELQWGPHRWTTIFEVR